MNATHTITISTTRLDDGSKGLKYTKNKDDAWSLKAARGEIVDWTTAEGHLAILFGERSPFDQNHFWRKKGGAPINAQVKAKAFCGSYKYSVILFPENGDPIFDDPEVWID